MTAVGCAIVDLEDLRAFVAVADTGSFLAAANALKVPRATVRRRVQALEVRAGVALLDANPRGVVLTDAGRAAIEAAAPDHVRTVRALFVDELGAGEVEVLTEIVERLLVRVRTGADGPH